MKFTSEHTQIADTVRKFVATLLATLRIFQN
jgi:hypothetical protein